MNVIKRDGRILPFEKEKVANAILKAFKDVDGEITSYANTKAKDIARDIEKLDRQLNIEEIQDIVEERLMSSNRKDVAKSYILYRDKRTRERERNSDLMKKVGEKLRADNVQNQNANVDEKSFGGRKGEAGSELMKQYALNYCMSEMSRENHLNNEIYIHDLDSYSIGCHNCLSIPFDKLLANGFNTRQTDVRPANSVNTAFQLVAVIFQIQSLQQFGGVSATHLDWTMIPYVRKSFFKHYIDGLKYVAHWDSESIESEKKSRMSFINFNIDDTDFYQISCAYQYAMDMTIKETQQAVEGMFHNLNTLMSRSGNQLPFTSINFGTCTLPEGRMVIKALLEGSIKGVGKFHKTPIFPKL